MNFIEKPEPIIDQKICWNRKACFDLRIPEKHTILQAYNCDRQRPGQKSKSMPAEKQFYRADYVLQHFVHYSVATVLSEKNKTEAEAEGIKWKRGGFPDPRQRFGNEVNEGLMLHSKAVANQDTAGFDEFCKIEHQSLPKKQRKTCRIGFPWPEDNQLARATQEGWAYNCYVNRKVEDIYVPRLIEKLKEFADVL